MFDSPSEFWTTVVVADHPAACDELDGASGCRPEAWVGLRRYADPPPSVRTAVVMGFGFGWPPAPAGISGTPPGTYAVSASCGFPSGTGVGAANAAFVVHDAAGRVVLVEEAVGGAVVVEELATGRRAAGTYRLTLSSGAVIRGDFAGDFCSKLASHLVGPCCPEPWSYGGTSESCACGGAAASSSCTQPAPMDPWTCRCVNADGSSSVCELPPGTRFNRLLCTQRFVTCCSMCP